MPGVAGCLTRMSHPVSTTAAPTMRCVHEQPCYAAFMHWCAAQDRRFFLLKGEEERRCLEHAPVIAMLPRSLEHVTNDGFQALLLSDQSQKRSNQGSHGRVSESRCLLAAIMGQLASSDDDHRTISGSLKRLIACRDDRDFYDYRPCS